MFKNTAGQSIALFAFDTTTGTPKTGDAANMVFYITKDWGSVTAISSNSGVPTEMDSTNAKGWYKIAVSQTETNADAVVLSGKSTTANISVTGRFFYTLPANFTSQSIDSNGRVDVIKINGTSQTARDLGASVLLSAGTGTGQLDFTSGVVKANATQLLGGTIPAPNVTGVPLVDLKYTLGTISPATAGSVRADSVAGAVGSVTGAVGSVTGNVGGNVVGSVASVTGNVGGNVVGSVASVTAGVTVTTNNDKTGYALTSGERTSVADALLDRDMSTGTDSVARSVRNALRFLRNKWSISGTVLTVTKEDDTTSAWTANLTATPGANPITTVDPT